MMLLPFLLSSFCSARNRLHQVNDLKADNGRQGAARSRVSGIR